MAMIPTLPQKCSSLWVHVCDPMPAKSFPSGDAFQCTHVTKRNTYGTDPN